jgi:hypothetical protein
MAEAPHLRISDEDREQAANAIREHYAAGRLDSTEFEERLTAVYAAKTRGELGALSVDLPPLPPKPPTKGELIRQNVTSNGLVRTAAGGGGLFLAATAIWAMTGANIHGFWPGWVLVFTLVTIVRRFRRGVRRGYGPRGGSGSGWGRNYSYRYDYRYGDGRHEHRHEHRS